jgi:hypothetical protein
MLVATKVKVRVDRTERTSDKAILVVLSRTSGAGPDEQAFWVPKSCFAATEFPHVAILTFNSWFRQIDSDFWLQIVETK